MDTPFHPFLTNCGAERAAKLALADLREEYG